jgi:glycosyltransferase involved in cell wall biosynthesis
MTVNDARDLVREITASGAHDRRLAEGELKQLAAFAQKGWQGLLAAMLLAPAWQWSDAPSLVSVPDWLRADYVAWLFAAPQGFCERGDAELYAAHTLKRLEELVRWVNRGPGANAEAEVLAVFSRTSVIPLYFAEGSLRKHAELRGWLLIRAFQLPSESFGPVALPRDGRRLRVGVVNRHFGPQTETYCTLPNFEQLDPERFEVILFAHRTTDTVLEAYSRQHASDFFLLPADIQEQLGMLRAAALDIVVFGTNVTAVYNEVTQIALHRVAALQVVNVSSCITSGLPEADLYVSGTMTETGGAEANFSERLALMPGPAHAFNYEADREDPKLPCTRAEFGIPDDAFLFVSGSNYFKIIPEIQHAWAKLLAAVPGSRLLLHPFNPNWSSSYPIKRFRAEFERVLASHGVEPSRLAISTLRFPSRTDVKGLLGLGDVYLDTYPFGGVTSLVDPLELALPVVVWEGGTFRSRMGAALLRQLELPELIAESGDAYHALATKLATDQTFRHAQRVRIKEKMERTPLFLDPLAASDAFGDVLEKAYDELAKVGHAAFRANRQPLLAGSGASAGADVAPLAIDDVGGARERLRDEPTNPVARHIVGRSLLEAGKNARAVTYLLAALQGEESNPQLWLDVARALAADGKLGEALQALEAGLKIDQTLLEGWKLFAALAEQLGSTEIANEARSVVAHLSSGGVPVAELPKAVRDTRRHVLVYTDDPGSGGVAQYNHNILLALARSGYRVSCVQTRADTPLIGEQQAAGIQHHWLDYHTNRDFARTLTDATLAEKLFQNDRPDLVIFSDCCPVSNLAAREAALQRGLPYIVVVGFVAEYLAKNFAGQLPQIARQHAGAREVIAVAEENLELLRRLFGTPAGKGRVIHYGRPDSYFSPRDAGVRKRLRAELGLPERAVVAFTAARLTGVKGFDLQLQAIAQVRRQSAGRDLHFVWAGDGEQREELAAAIAKLGLSDCIHLLGQRWDVAEWLDAADVFVLPSRLEGMPLCIMEAMAKGLPVIATAVSGIPEELGDTGKLLPNPAIDPAKTVAELARTLAHWAADSKLRAELGARARARADSMFREQRMCARTLRLVCDQLAVNA